MLDVLPYETELAWSTSLPWILCEWVTFQTRRGLACAGLPDDCHHLPYAEAWLPSRSRRSARKGSECPEPTLGSCIGALRPTKGGMIQNDEAGDEKRRPGERRGKRRRAEEHGEDIVRVRPGELQQRRERSRWEHVDVARAREPGGEHAEAAQREERRLRIGRLRK